MSAPIESAAAQKLFGRDSTNASVLIADGYGIAVSVNRGHLTIEDGIGKTRRERRLPKAQREVRRIVVLGHTGHITLDAVRFCADTGIALTQIDTDGRVLFVAGAPGKDDARLRRAQAAAPNAPVGLEITRALLTAKIEGQAAVLADILQNENAASMVAELTMRLRTGKSLPECRDIESQAANVYFGAWAGTVQCRFATKDRAKIPGHWTYFAVRRSPLLKGRSPSSAADPINALLNYAYALAEAECVLAARAVGLDPGLGIVHTDTKSRDSLALDLLEPLRPLVERQVLQLLEHRHFTTEDVFETRQGVCRLLPPITHELAEGLSSYATVVAPLAEQVAHAIAKTSPGKITLTTPLTRANVVAAQQRGKRSANRRPPTEAKARPTCRDCGTDLYGSARKLCPSCWPIWRASYNREMGFARAKPSGPLKPTAEQVSGGITFERYQQEILPALTNIPLPMVERATGLGPASCSRIRRGLQVPNPRLWAALSRLVEQDLHSVIEFKSTTHRQL
jgi:CRISPR-associated endonuclease Cas1